MSEQTSEPESTDSPSSPDAPSSPDSSPDASVADPNKPTYKGAPLDAEAGPGLGCFYVQVVLLVILLIVTPLSVVWAVPPWISAALLILTLVILFFVGMTMVFLLRLVAADRRAQRRPLREGARKTVGQLESEEKDAGTGDSAPDP